MVSSSLPGDPDDVIQPLLALSTSNVSDALDRLQLQGAPHGLLPLWPQCRKIAGRVMTLKLVPQGAESPVHGTLETLKAMQPGDILVIDHAGRTDVASWGGLMTFTAVHRGVAGVIIDGVTRDLGELKQLDFPAYGRGVIQQSLRGRCAFGGRGLEIHLAGTLVRSGDIVLADEDGVVIIPAQRATEVLALAQRNLEVEERIKSWISQGMDPREAFERAAYNQLTSAAPSSSR